MTVNQVARGLVRVEIERSQISRDEILRVFNSLRHELLQIPNAENCSIQVKLSVGGDIV